MAPLPCDRSAGAADRIRPEAGYRHLQAAQMNRGMNCLADETARHWPFVAVDHATHWAYLRFHPDRSDTCGGDFLRRLRTGAPGRSREPSPMAAANSPTASPATAGSGSSSDDRRSSPSRLPEDWSVQPRAMPTPERQRVLSRASVALKALLEAELAKGIASWRSGVSTPRPCHRRTVGWRVWPAPRGVDVQCSVSARHAFAFRTGQRLSLQLRAHSR